MRCEFAILYMEKRKHCCNYIMTTLQNLEEIESQHRALTKPLQNAGFSCGQLQPFRKGPKNYNQFKQQQQQN